MIRTSYVVSQSEWAEAQQLWSKRASTKLPGSKGLKWVGFSLGIPIGLSVHYIPLWLSGLFALYLLGAYLFDRWRKKAIRQYLYAQATDRDQETELTIDDDGYTSERPGFNECRMKWRCFTGWREGSTVFVLGRSIQFCIVPKSSLDEQQRTELRDVLNANLPAV
jgi:hypothetical protein